MRFARQLVSRGHTVRVVTYGDPANSGFDKESGLCMYYVTELRLPLVSKLARKQNTLIAYPKKGVLQEAITGADVVHIYQAWPLGGKARSIAKCLGVPCVAAFHIQPENITWNMGLQWFKPAVRLSYFLMRVLFYRRFEHIHCPSLMIAAQLRRHGYKAWLHVISNGVHPDFRPDKGMKKFDDGKFHILTVGRLSPEKRHDILLKAAALSHNADKIQLHIAGQGPRERKLRKLAAKLPNPPEFVYHSQASLINLMRRCHLYVHPSDIEIEGMGCTEAFSTGLVPVISDSSRSATGQFALTRKNLFKAGDAKSLARRLDYWIENPTQLEDAGEEYIHFSRDYTLDKCVSMMERVYSGAVSSEKCVYHRGALFRLLSRICTAYIAIPILFLWTRLVLGVRVEGTENLRGLSGAVTICNHVHLLDGALVGIAMFPRKVAVPTLVSNLHGLFPGALVNLLGGLPIPAKPSDMKLFFDEMQMRLLMGEMVLFFPEGHLEPYNTQLRDFKSGAFHLAAKARTPVIPLAILFVPPKGVYRLLRRKPVMHLKIGKPIYPMLNNSKDNVRQLQMVARNQMESLVAQM
jgi:glycosyltransferase involved in cell wall biosynthesis/1-acyl-sn-glycerol-3-phosphate acyltransferase